MIFDLDRAVQFLEIRPYDVHTYAAPRQFSHVLFGGESRPENEVENLRRAQFSDLLFGNESLLDRLTAHALHIDSGAIIADCHLNLVTLLPRLDPDGSLTRFAGRYTQFGAFDSMIERVAHEVNQRIVDVLHHVLVELGFLAADQELDLFSVSTRHIAHQAGKFAEY